MPFEVVGKPYYSGLVVWGPYGGLIGPVSVKILDQDTGREKTVLLGQLEAGVPGPLWFEPAEGNHVQEEHVHEYMDILHVSCTPDGTTLRGYDADIRVCPVCGNVVQSNVTHWDKLVPVQLETEMIVVS